MSTSVVEALAIDLRGWSVVVDLVEGPRPAPVPDHAVAVVVAIYVVLLQGFTRLFSRGSAGYNWILAAAVTVIVLLLAPSVKRAVQNGLDRVFYRDRYDYRRALVGFARDLNSDLDLNRLAERFVARVMETLLVDRMALMVASEDAPQFEAVAASGFDVGHEHRPIRRAVRAPKLVPGRAVRSFEVERAAERGRLEFAEYGEPVWVDVRD